MQITQNDLNLVTSLPRKNLPFEHFSNAFYDLQVSKEFQIKILKSLPTKEVISFKRKPTSYKASEDQKLHYDAQCHLRVTPMSDPCF